MFLIVKQFDSSQRRRRCLFCPKSQLLKAGKVRENMDSNAPMAPTSKIVCRPGSNIGILIAVFGSMGLCYLFMAYDIAHDSHRQHADPVVSFAFLAIGLAMLTTSAAALYWALHARMEATDDGLRWRQFGEWATADWGEIEDYYLIPSLKPGERWAFQVGSRRYPVMDYWTNRAALKSTIAAHAKNAVAQDWEMLGCRANELQPRMFLYTDASTRADTIMPIIMWLVAIAILFIPGHIEVPQRWEGVIGMELTILPLALIGHAVAISRLRDIRARRSQRIETSSLGVTFTDEKRVVSMEWASIRRYEYSHHGRPVKVVRRYSVESRDGSFDFTISMREFAQLDTIIRHWAPAKSIVASDAETDALGGERARWTGGSPGVGDRIFHYRTRFARAMLWPPLALSIASPVILLVQPISIWIVLYWLFFVVWFALGYWIYRREMVIVSNAGITCVSALKSRFIPWEEITEYRDWPKAARMTVSTRAEKIVIHDFIVGKEELRREIVLRAVNSVSKGWEAGKQNG